MNLKQSTINFLAAFIVTLFISWFFLTWVFYSVSGVFWFIIILVSVIAGLFAQLLTKVKDLQARVDELSYQVFHK